MPGHRASTLQTLDTCPKQYQLRRDNPEAVNYGVEMERGSAFAAFACGYRKALLTGSSHEEATAAGHRAVEQGGYSQEALADAEFFIDRFLSVEHVQKDPDAHWFVEHLVAFDRDFNLADSSRDAYYSGAMDFGIIKPVSPGSTSVEITALDDKTYRVIPPLSELKRDRKMGGYILGLDRIARANGYTPVSWTVALQFAMDGTLQQYSLTREEVDALPGILAEWCRSADEMTEFEPKPGVGKCLRCCVRYRCNAFISGGLANAGLDPRNPEEAVALAARYASLESQAEDAREALKVYLNRVTTGIPMPDGKTLNLFTEEKAFVVEDAVAIMLEKGVPLDEVLAHAKVNRAAVKKILRRVPSGQAAEIDRAITNMVPSTAMRAK